MKASDFWGIAALVVVFFFVYSFLAFLSGGFNPSYAQTYYSHGSQSNNVILAPEYSSDYNTYPGNEYNSENYGNSYTTTSQLRDSVQQNYQENYQSDSYGGGYVLHHQNVPSYYPVVNEAMRTVEYHECYTRPPRGQLFYIECP